MKMPRSDKYLLKICRYIRHERQKKLKLYVCKHELDLREFELQNGGNLLHCCVKHNNTHVILSYLLESGVSAKCPDKHGDFPAHLALRRALTMPAHEAGEFYEEVLQPLLRESGPILREFNSGGQTCRDLWNQLLATGHLGASAAECSCGAQDCHHPKCHPSKCHPSKCHPSKCHPSKCHPSKCHPSKTEEDNFFARLSTATEADAHDCHDFSFQGWAEEEKNETFGEWGDRLWREYGARQSRQRQKSTGKSRDHSSASQSDGATSSPKQSTSGPPPPPKATPGGSLAWERSQGKSQTERDRRQWLLHRKSVYEASYASTVSCLSGDAHSLTFTDIPWPSANVTTSIEILFVDLDHGSEKYRHYLREQQVRWHPDKFLQRFGANLAEKDREKIKGLVTELSQALNKLSDASQ